nr:MAG TPA: hypothetical protein [Caudoviricetes sp.]
MPRQVCGHLTRLPDLTDTAIRLDRTTVLLFWFSVKPERKKI